MSKMTGMRFVAEALRGYGVDHVFYVPQMLLDTLVEMEGWGIKRVMTHGEKAAAYMADGYARASRKPGTLIRNSRITRSSSTPRSSMPTSMPSIAFRT